jgi:aspartyl/asparaginyl-tRNA synthetase
VLLTGRTWSANTPFERITYTRAIEILEEVVKSKKKKFEFAVSFLHCLKLV